MERQEGPVSNVNNEGLRTLDEIRARRALVQGAVSAYENSTPARADQPGGLFSHRLNPGELEEIEARLRAATDGPWTVYVGHTGIRNTLPYTWVGPEVEQWDGSRKIAPVVERADGGTMADMRFIAHARTDVEKLINTINALSRRVAKRFNEAAEARQEAAEARQEAARARERLEREVNRLTTELHQARTKIEAFADACAAEYDRLARTAIRCHQLGDTAEARRVAAQQRVWRAASDLAREHAERGRTDG